MLMYLNRIICCLSNSWCWIQMYPSLLIHSLIYVSTTSSHIIFNFSLTSRHTWVNIWITSSSFLHLIKRESTIPPLQLIIWWGLLSSRIWRVHLAPLQGIHFTLHSSPFVVPYFHQSSFIFIIQLSSFTSRPSLIPSPISLRPSPFTHHFRYRHRAPFPILLLPLRAFGQ